jgi:hypothetical protein
MTVKSAKVSLRFSDTVVPTNAGEQAVGAFAEPLDFLAEYQQGMPILLNDVGKQLVQLFYPSLQLLDTLGHS